MAARRVLLGAIRSGVWEVDNAAGQRIYLGRDGVMAAEMVEQDRSLQLLALPALPEPDPQVWLCVRCELTGGPYLRLGEAAYLAAVHDQLHHGSTETAEVYPDEPVAAAGGATW